MGNWEHFPYTQPSSLLSLSLRDAASLTSCLASAGNTFYNNSCDITKSADVVFVCGLFV